jgi:hypothetical protein
LGTGHLTSRSHIRCSDKFRSAPAQTAFRRHTENILSVNSRKLGSRGGFFPSPGSIPFARQHPDYRSGAESAYLPGRTQTVAILPAQRLVSSRSPQFLLGSPTISSYTVVRFVASEAVSFRAGIGDMEEGSPTFAARRGSFCPRTPVRTSNSDTNGTFSTTRGPGHSDKNRTSRDIPLAPLRKDG